MPVKAPHSETSLFRQSIISTRQNLNLGVWAISHREVPFDTTAEWSVRKLTLHGGKQEGVEIIEVDNGRLRFVVIPTRGMSVLKVESGDVRLGWDSPVKEVVHPQFIRLESRGGLGWLDGFNEWMVRCGLEWAGHPGHDKFRNGAGEEVELELTLHGKIGNLPASEVEVFIEAGPPARMHIRGLVEERMFHGPQLSIWTDISTELGSNSVRFDDAITNQGMADQEFQIIYHMNFGAPLLEAGSHFVGPIARVTSFDPQAAKSAKAYAHYAGPKPGTAEQVYCLHPLAGADNRTEVLLKNAKSNRGVSLAFSPKELPCLTLWKNLASEAEGYVTGIEPGTGFPYTRQREREAGRVPKLAPDETRHFTIQVAIHSDPMGVEAAEQRIRNLQGGTETIIDGGTPGSGKK